MQGSPRDRRFMTLALLCSTIWASGFVVRNSSTSAAAEPVEDPSSSTTSGPPTYTHFESGPVRPIARSTDGRWLFVANISDAHLEIFEIVDGAGELNHHASVPVGLEPVAIAVENPHRVWVVNHLSDSVSIVDLGLDGRLEPQRVPRVVRTLLVGDEPRDIVFAGGSTGGDPGGDAVGETQAETVRRAFVTTARRGQNHTVDPGLEETSSGRASVWVFDAAQAAESKTPRPLTVLTLFGDTPRPLAVSPDGGTVYAGVFRSGNRTTTLTEIIDELMVRFDGDRKLEPTTNFEGHQAPHVSRILQEDDRGRWLDVEGNDFDEQIPFTLPDYDVFAIDARAEVPTEVARWSGVGTVVFNMVAHPRSGEVFVTNSEANNMVRFEGPGDHVRRLRPELRRSEATVQGKLHLYRVSILGADGRVTARHLNKHIDYDLEPAQAEKAGFRERSLATPLELVFDSSGERLFVAAFGSSKVGVLDAEALRNDRFVPNASHHIELSAGGPAGLVLDETRDRLYVYSRFDNAVSVVELTQGQNGETPGREVTVVPLPNNPEPEQVRAGRRFLYDARLTSSNGEASCSSCHVFADHDGLAWDLGNPDDVVSYNNLVQRAFPLDELESDVPEFFGPRGPLRPTFTREFHPMKGPMMTQTLRGLDGQGPLHWRGDRRGTSAEQRREDPAGQDSLAAFVSFNVAFEGLLGRADGELSSADMETFARFHLGLPYGPNPFRALDNSLDAREANGHRIFTTALTSAPRAATGAEPTLTCNSCHVLDPEEQHFGSGGVQAFDALNQMFKVPHLRELYQKIGMSGQQDLPSAGDTGPAVRGYGLNSDGFVSSAYSFVGGRPAAQPDDERTFRFPGDTAEEKRSNRRDMERFLYAFDTDTLPAMGQQVTLTGSNASVPIVAGRDETVSQRLDLLRARALHELVPGDLQNARPDCDLIAKAPLGRRIAGWVLEADGSWLSDRGERIDDASLRAMAGTEGVEITFTCVPPGSGHRMGIDRDLDGRLDGPTG